MDVSAADDPTKRHQGRDHPPSVADISLLEPTSDISECLKI